MMGMFYQQDVYADDIVLQPAEIKIIEKKVSSFGDISGLSYQYVTNSSINVLYSYDELILTNPDKARTKPEYSRYNLTNPTLKQATIFRHRRDSDYSGVTYVVLSHHLDQPVSIVGNTTFNVSYEGVYIVILFLASPAWFVFITNVLSNYFDKANFY